MQRRGGGTVRFGDEREEEVRLGSPVAAGGTRLMQAHESRTVRMVAAATDEVRLAIGP